MEVELGRGVGANAWVTDGEGLGVMFTGVEESVRSEEMVVEDDMDEVVQTHPVNDKTDSMITVNNGVKTRLLIDAIQNSMINRSVNVHFTLNKVGPQKSSVKRSGTALKGASSSLQDLDSMSDKFILPVNVQRMVVRT